MLILLSLKVQLAKNKKNIRNVFKNTKTIFKTVSTDLRIFYFNGIL